MMNMLSPQYLTLLIVTISTLFRVILAWKVGLGVDESYVVSLARTFSLSYFDHPPLHFWIIWLTQQLTGSENGLVLRLPFIGMFAATTWLMYRLGAKLFGEWSGVYAALILNVSPVFSLSTGSWILPDGPLFLALISAALVLVKLFFEPAAHSPYRWWVAAGLLTGLSMLAKYHALFLIFGTFIFLLTTKERRGMLLSAGPYLAVGIAGIMFLPVLIWNQEHNWVSFLFQGGRGAPKGLSPWAMLGNIAGQAAWILPWIWAPLVWILSKSILAGPGNTLTNSSQNKQWFLCCLAIGPIAIFTTATLWGAQGLFHWQAPGYFWAIPLLGRAVAGWLDSNKRITRTWLAASVTAFLLLVTILGSHTATGWLRQFEPQWFNKGDPSTEALDWRELPAYLATQGFASQAEFVVAANWIDAGKIDYILGGQFPVLCLNNEPHHFAFLHNPADYQGKNALIMGRKQSIEKALLIYQPYFTSIEPVGTMSVTRAGIAEFAVGVFYAKGFTGTFPLPYR